METRTFGACFIVIALLAFGSNAFSQNPDPLPPGDIIAEKKAQDEAAAKKAAENEKVNKKAIEEIDKKLKNLDRLKDADKVKALEAMKKYIQDHLKEDPATVLDGAAKAAKKAVATGDIIKDAGSDDMVDRLKSDLAKKIFGLVLKATGTGQTTGNIVNIIVTNNSDYPVAIMPQTFYIPSSGQYQSYVGRIPGGITVPPNGTTNIPVNGYCTDVNTPPVPSGTTMTPEEDGIPVGVPPQIISTNAVPQVPDEMNPPTSAGPPSGFPIVIITNDLQPKFTPDAIPEITGSPGFNPVSPNPEDDIIITWPGTTTPVEGTFDPRQDPESFARVVVELVQRVEEAADVIQDSGDFPTPFTNDPPRERESLIQQQVWIFCAAVTGDKYEKEDFADNVYDQFSDKTGLPVATLPKERKDELDSGIDDFWNAFQATGVEAKVIKAQPEPEDQEPPIEISEKVGGCKGEVDLQMNPPYELDMKITEQWGSAQERQESIDAVNKALGQDIQITPEGAFAAYDISRHPTSSTSFWKAGNVGGFASAYAKTWFKKADGSSEWVWGTEKLETNADGTMDYSMTYTHDETCRALVAGSALIRIRASSSAFDAMAGNTHLENDTEQLNFLRGTQYAAQISLEWLMKRTRGRANQSFKDYVADDLKEKIKGEISDAVKAEVEAMAEAHMGQMLSQMGLNLNTLMNLELPSLEELIENTFGIEIPLLKDVEEFISKGIEAVVNLPFVSNTYATANGHLVVHVGGNSGSVQAQTSVHYSRQSTEETKDAIRWKGEDCKEDFVSDAQPDALNIHTQGLSNMVAHAESKFGFGNGQAEAFLESMNLQILTGICICPAQRKGIDQSTYELNVQGHMEWYTADEGHQQALESALESMLQNVEDQMIEELDGMSEDAVNNLTTSQFEKMLADKVRAWGDANKFAWRACQN